MRIVVAGATGRTGRRVLEQALDRGHDVTALARRPDALPGDLPGLTRVAADVLRPDAWMDAVAGADAVVSALGAGTSRKPTHLYSGGVANLLEAMGTHGVPTLAVISAAPVGPREDQSLLDRRLLMPVLDRLFGATYADMRRMEELLRDSDVGWISLRPPRLVGHPPTGRYRLDVQPLPRARSITYGDLAGALVDSLDRADLRRRAAYVAN